ncbi:hypothetical protein [Cryptosporangium arvum]|uniref:hypothetical protein n=1 Tax=Cryptosporangium arvum TaxID=80871 RepID=UPI0004B7F46B|nr:hypothetical protein [Cryptosporangium arvum]
MTPSELDLLADYAEGLLEGTPDGEVVAARIATDQEWSDAYRQLTAVAPGITAELSALPEIPMPAAVAASLDGALASVPAPATDDEPASADLGRLRAEKAARDRGARRWRVAGGWVAAAAVVGALCLGVGQLVTSTSDDSSDESAAASKNDSATDVLSAPATRSSGVSYSTRALAQQARALVEGREAAAPAPSAGGSATPSKVPAASDVIPAALQRLTSPSELRNCLTALGITIRPFLVDYATLDGTPALVVVTEDADPSRVTVVAAGPECGVDGNGDERARSSYTR